jgi:hypothetical protein
VIEMTANVSAKRSNKAQRAASNPSRLRKTINRFDVCHSPMLTASANSTRSCGASVRLCRASNTLSHRGSTAPAL